MPSQDTLVSHGRRRNFYLIGKAIGAWSALFSAVFCLGEISAAVPMTPAEQERAPVPLTEPAHDSLIMVSLDLLQRGAYASADSLLRRLPDIPARSYFRGLVLAARCNDLGDTSALAAAEAEWERLDRAGDEKASPLAKDPHYGIYRGLAELQLSYVAGLHGARLQAARLGRRAAKRLEAYPDIAEAASALALYDYYKAELLQGIDWIPFVRADRAGPLRRLEAAVPRSRYLHATLLASLLWIYYDTGRYREGMLPIRGFLARYPGNRVWRQMLADFQFRGAPAGTGSLDSALALHLALAAEYQTLSATCPPPACLPLGYLCSIGNLAKIYAARKQPELLQRELDIWASPRYAMAKPWLPASLVKEVAALRKEKPTPK
jgi:hypothetical protein